MSSYKLSKFENCYPKEREERYECHHDDPVLAIDNITQQLCAVELLLSLACLRPTQALKARTTAVLNLRRLVCQERLAVARGRINLHILN